MIIHNLYFMCIAINPLEANSPLFIDTDAVLAAAVCQPALRAYYQAELAVKSNQVQHGSSKAFAWQLAEFHVVICAHTHG